MEFDSTIDFDYPVHYCIGYLKKNALPGVTAGRMGWVTDTRRFPISILL